MPQLRQVAEEKQAGWLRAALLYGSVMEGLIAVGMLLGTYALLELPVSVPLVVLAFCGTFLVYQADRALGWAPEDTFNHPERLAWIRRHRRYVWGSSILAAGVGAAVLPLLRPATLALGAALGLLSLLYLAPVLPQGRRLKTIWFLKPVAIGTAWAAGGVLVPVLEAGRGWTPIVWVLVAYRFLFILPNPLLLDWRDRAGDAQAGLRSVATEWPAGRLRTAAALALAGALAIGGYALGRLDVSWLLYLDLGGPLLMLYAVHRPRPGWASPLVLNALVAWPLVTAAVAWLGCW